MEVTVDLRKVGLYAAAVIAALVLVWLVLHPGRGRGESATPTPAATVETEASPTATKEFEPLPPTATPATASTATPETRVVAVTNSDGVHLRGGPGTAFAIKGKARRGQEFQVVGRNKDGSWVEVCCWKGEKVWIYAKLVDIATEPVNTARAGHGKGLNPTPTPPREGFSKNAYVPLDCGPYEPGERVTVVIRGPQGKNLDPGWFFQQGPTANADATGWIHLFLVTQDWPVGVSMVTCRGEKGKEYKMVVPVVEDSGSAVRLDANATPSGVSARALKTGNVYVRVIAPGFKPMEFVKMTIAPPGQAPQPFGRMQADWVGEAASVILLNPGDPSGEWTFTTEGEETHHKEVVRFTVQ